LNSELFLNENEAGSPAPSEVFGWSKNEEMLLSFRDACQRHAPFCSSFAYCLGFSPGFRAPVCDFRL